LENARPRNQYIVNVGVDGVRVSSKDIKPDRAVAF
jgi:hypothetical protein